MRIVCLGDAVVDVTVRLQEPLAPGSDATSQTSIQPGGQAANVAAWLRYAGAHSFLAPQVSLDATLVARVGADLFGRFLRDEYAARGLDLALSVDPDRATGVCTVLVDPDGERTMLPDPGANDAAADWRDDLLADAALLFVSGYALLRDTSRPAAIAAIAAARAREVPIALDASSSAPLERVGWPLVHDWLAGPALLFMNSSEAPPTTVGEVVLKLGRDGARWTDGRRIEQVAAVPVEVLDTTGAGDAFAAGLLAARVRGADPVEALRAGAELAAVAIARVGAWPPTPAGD